MSTAIGDLVATFSVDCGAWNSGIAQAVTSTRRFDSGIRDTVLALEAMPMKTNQAVATTRQFTSGSRALAGTINMVGNSVGAYNAELGANISLAHSGITTVVSLVKSWTGFGAVLDFLRAKLIVFNALLGPIGWITLAAAAVVAIGVYMNMASAVDAETEALRKNNDERTKQFLEGNISVPRKKLEEMSASELTTQKEDASRSISATALAVVDLQKKYKAASSAAGEAKGFAAWTAAAEAQTEAARALKQAQRELSAEQARLGAIGSLLAAATEVENRKKISEVLDQAKQKYLEVAYSADKAKLAAFAMAGMAGVKPEDIDKITEWTKATEELTAKQAAAKAAEDARANGFKSAQTQIASLTAEVNGLAKGWSAAQIEADKYARTPGATPEQIKQIKNLATSKERLNKAKSLTAEFATPLEKARKKVDEAMALNIAPEILDRVKLAAAQELASSEKGPKAKSSPEELPKILERGSQEAWSKIMASMYGTDKDKAADETASNTKKTADALERIERRGEDEPADLIAG